VWTLTPDAFVSVTKHGNTNPQQLTAAVDGILRSIPLREPFFAALLRDGRR
jgi:hypothetical protein